MICGGELNSIEFNLCSMKLTFKNVNVALADVCIIKGIIYLLGMWTQFFFFIVVVFQLHFVNTSFICYLMMNWGEDFFFLSELTLYILWKYTLYAMNLCDGSNWRGNKPLKKIPRILFNSKLISKNVKS